MPFCPKCGSKVAEEMQYCPKCGASLKVEAVPRERREKQEKSEKQEKQEKGEKHEKGEVNRFWMLIGGLILVTLGVLSFLTSYLNVPEFWRGAFFLVIVGIIIIVFALYGVVRASKRSPRP